MRKECVVLSAFLFLPFLARAQEAPSASQAASSGEADASLPRMAVEEMRARQQEPGASPQEGESPRSEAALPGMGDAAQPAAPSSLPTEVVVKGEGGIKVKAEKPPLAIQVDPFESIRDSLKPDQQLLLAESPFTVVWRRTHPEFLRHARVIQPWLTPFSERRGIVLRPLEQLAAALQRKPEGKELKRFNWNLTIADEEGKVFQQYQGNGAAPEEIVWSGQNDQEEWLRAGRAYSPVYLFTDAAGTPYTRVGKPLRFKGVAHQERTGMHISLDASALFGANKDSRAIQTEGRQLLRAAADLIKRRYPGIPVRVEMLSGSKELAQAQGQLVEEHLARELMLMPQDLALEALRVPYVDQRVEIVLLNR